MNYQKNYFAQLKEVSKGIIQSYHNDLDIHAKNQLESIQTDFLFACRKNGADLVKLVQKKEDIEAYFSPKDLKSLLDEGDFASRFSYYKRFCLLWVYGLNKRFFIASNGKVTEIGREQVDVIAEKYFNAIHEYLNQPVNAININARYQHSLEMYFQTKTPGFFI